MIRAKVMDGESRRQINFSGNGLARFDVESGLGGGLVERREEAAFAGIDFKTEPAVAVAIVEIDVPLS